MMFHISQMVPCLLFVITSISIIIINIIIIIVCTVWCFKETNTFLLYDALSQKRQRHLKENDTKISISNKKLSFWTFYSSKNLGKCFNVFKNDSKKCFLNSKSAYWSDFWKIMWHWRLVMMLKIQLCLTWINYILKYIHIYIYIYIYIPIEKRHFKQMLFF